MDIAAGLQHEASERAGSSEGFLEVIRLVLDNIESGKVDGAPCLFSSRTARPEWAMPENYLPILCEYVDCMQEMLRLKKKINDIAPPWMNERYAPDNSKAVLTRISVLIHAAKSKKRELPIHAYKRLLAIENQIAPRLGGRDNLYLPQNWDPMSAMVLAYISNFGVGRGGSHGDN